jgi:nicotinate-nucleotide adenylyltransferase
MEMPEELKELYERHFTGENRITRPFGELFFIESRPFDISSTRLREMLKERNAGVSEYLPDAALEYIKRNGLYL